MGRTVLQFGDDLLSVGEWESFENQDSYTWSLSSFNSIYRLPQNSWLLIEPWVKINEFVCPELPDFKIERYSNWLAAFRTCRILEFTYKFPIDNFPILFMFITEEKSFQCRIWRKKRTVQLWGRLSLIIELGFYKLHFWIFWVFAIHLHGFYPVSIGLVRSSQVKGFWLKSWWKKNKLFLQWCPIVKLQNNWS